MKCVIRGAAWQGKAREQTTARRNAIQMPKTMPLHHQILVATSAMYLHATDDAEVWPKKCFVSLAKNNAQCTSHTLALEMVLLAKCFCILNLRHHRPRCISGRSRVACVCVRTCASVWVWAMESNMYWQTNTTCLKAILGKNYQITMNENIKFNLIQKNY